MPKIFPPRTVLLTSGVFLVSVLVGMVLSEPTRVSAQASGVPDGAALFTSSGCVQCHGNTGLGTGKGPSLRGAAKKLSADQMRRQIHDGGQMMPPFGDALTEPQIDSLVRYLRSKKPWNKHP